MSETNKAYYWNRVGYVEIEGEDGKMHRYGGSHDGLDYKFDIDYAGDTAVEFKVGILGLGRETIQRLTVWNMSEALTRARKIVVYAGYEKDGLSREIASGIVTQAIPTSPPEMWLNFNCLIGTSNYDAQKARCVKGKTRKEILSMLAKMNNTPESRWDAKKVSGDDVIDKFYTEKTPVYMIDKFAEDNNILVYMENGILIACDKNAWDNPESIRSAEVVNVDTGLLSIGNIDLVGATIRRRLDVRSRLMTWIKMESVIMPSSNSHYYIIRRKLVGQYRGKDWYTELQMIRRRT